MDAFITEQLRENDRYIFQLGWCIRWGHRSQIWSAWGGVVTDVKLADLKASENQNPDGFGNREEVANVKKKQK